MSLVTVENEIRNDLFFNVAQITIQLYFMDFETVDYFHGLLLLYLYNSFFYFYKLTVEKKYLLNLLQCQPI